MHQNLLEDIAEARMLRAYGKIDKAIALYYEPLLHVNEDVLVEERIEFKNEVRELLKEYNQIDCLKDFE